MSVLAGREQNLPSRGARTIVKLSGPLSEENGERPDMSRRRVMLLFVPARRAFTETVTNIVSASRSVSRLQAGAWTKTSFSIRNSTVD